MSHARAAMSKHATVFISKGILAQPCSCYDPLVLPSTQAAVSSAAGARQAAAAAAQMVRLLKGRYFRGQVLHAQDPQQQQQPLQVLEQQLGGVVSSDQGLKQEESKLLDGRQEDAKQEGDQSAKNDGNWGALGKTTPSANASSAHTHHEGLAASAASEDCVGVRLCDLSHEEIMAAFAEYGQRQSDLPQGECVCFLACSLQA